MSSSLSPGSGGVERRQSGLIHIFDIASKRERGRETGSEQGVFTFNHARKAEATRRRSNEGKLDRKERRI